MLGADTITIDGMAVKIVSEIALGIVRKLDCESMARNCTEIGLQIAAYR